MPHITNAPYQPITFDYYRPPTNNIPVVAPQQAYTQQPVANSVRDFPKTQWDLICKADLANREIKPLGFFDSIAFDQKDQNMVRYAAFWRLPEITKIRGFLTAANKVFQENLTCDAAFNGEDLSNIQAASKLMNQIGLPSHSDERLYGAFKRAQVNALRHSSTEDIKNAIQSNNNSFLQEEIGRMQEILVNAEDPIQTLRVDIADMDLPVMRAIEQTRTNGAQRNALVKLQNLLVDYKKLALEGKATESVERQQDEARLFQEIGERVTDLVMEKYEHEAVKKLSEMLHSLGMLYLMAATAHERTAQIMYEGYEKKNRSPFARANVTLNEGVKISEQAYLLAHKYYSLSVNSMSQELTKASYEEENLKHTIYAKISSYEMKRLQNNHPKDYWDYVGIDNIDLQKLINGRVKIVAQMNISQEACKLIANHLTQRGGVSRATLEAIRRSSIPANGNANRGNANSGNANIELPRVVTAPAPQPAYIAPQPAYVAPPVQPEDRLKAMRIKAEGQISANRTMDAIATYEEILKIAPNSLQDLFNLAGLSRSVHDLYKAVDCYNKILAINPNDQQVYLELGHAYKQFDFVQQANDHYTFAYNVNPNSQLGQRALKILQNRA